MVSSICRAPCPIMGTLARTSPVAGLVTARVVPYSAPTQRPPIRHCVRSRSGSFSLMRTAAAAADGALSEDALPGADADDADVHTPRAAVIIGLDNAGGGERRCAATTAEEQRPPPTLRGVKRSDFTSLCATILSAILARLLVPTCLCRFEAGVKLATRARD